MKAWSRLDRHETNNWSTCHICWHLKLVLKVVCLMIEYVLSKSIICLTCILNFIFRHTNTKNYHCNQCEKSFVCSSVLKRHLLCHNKSNHESCRFCGKKFSRLDNRKRHEAVMHGVTDNTDEKLISWFSTKSFHMHKYLN